MLSPFTGGPAIEIQTNDVYTMRGQKFAVPARCYQCTETNRQFTTDEQDDDFLETQERIYRKRNSIPAPADLKKRRKQLELSAREASRLLGFGPNQFRQYEAGDFPSESNMKAIRMFLDDDLLPKLLEWGAMSIAQRTAEKLQAAIEARLAVRRGARIAPALSGSWESTYVSAADEEELRQAATLYAKSYGASPAIGAAYAVKAS